MSILPEDFISAASQIPTYWYEGRCPQSQQWLRLPRTREVEAIAADLMDRLAASPVHHREGKMYGVLLVKTPAGTRQVLQAFSGLLQGQSRVEGWVPPIPGREQIALEEARTLVMLEAIKQELLALHQAPERQQYLALVQSGERQLQALAACHAERKHHRQFQRQQLQAQLTGAALETALEALNHQSRRDGIERRRLKQQQEEQRRSLQAWITQADQRIQALKAQRKELSRQLQTQMHTHYRLTNFAGQSLTLEQLSSDGGLPTGTGDCCAPKLLHYAASHGLQPLALAEFWWGPAQGDRVPGQFYGACSERCQPLMGFLLSGLGVPEVTTSPVAALAILYEDEGLIAVDKPAGLLSVPGRTLEHQDSVLLRLQNGLSDRGTLLPIHRLDQDTSGVLLLAKERASHRDLSLQFQKRQIHKVYEALVTGWVKPEEGTIELPLASDPQNRPYQQVDRQRGKPSLTRFRVLSRDGEITRIQFVPLTGRTHQLRVHAAHPEGLGYPILGDRLYGKAADRLYLHACELQFTHPRSRQRIRVQAPTPF